MCLTLKKLYYLKSLYKKSRWVARAKAAIIIIFNKKITNLLNINLIEINNLTSLDILIILKKMISQKIISKRKRRTSARMQK